MTSLSRLGSLPVILHCDKALFVVCGGGKYIYIWVSKKNKQVKKNIPQGPKFWHVRVIWAHCLSSFKFPSIVTGGEPKKICTLVKRISTNKNFPVQMFKCSSCWCGKSATWHCWCSIIRSHDSMHRQRRNENFFKSTLVHHGDLAHDSVHAQPCKHIYIRPNTSSSYHD